MMTDNETQKYLFGNNVDMKLLDEYILELVKKIPNVGKSNKLIIDIREDEKSRSLKDIVDEVDKEYSANNIHLDMLRINRIENHIVITGVKL